MIRRPKPSPTSRLSVGLDPRIWTIIASIGFFAFLVLKEVQLPAPVILGFGGLGLLGLLIAGLQDPAIAFYVLIAYMPFSRVLVGDFGTQATALNFTNILMGWVIIAHALNRLSQRQRVWEPSPLNKFVWLFVLMGALSLFRAGFEYGSEYMSMFVIPLKQWLTPVLMYFLSLNIGKDRKTAKTTVVIIMVAVTIVGLMAIYDYMDESGASFDKSRVGGIAEQPNTLGAFFDYYMFLLLGFFLIYANRVKAWLLLIPFAICFRGIMVTFSRGAYLGFAAGSLAATFFRQKVLFVLAIFLGLWMYMNPVLLPAGIRYRMGMTYVGESRDPEDPTQGLESSAAQRLEIWKGALRMVHDHPWFGIGYGAFPSLIAGYTGGATGAIDAHNSYLLIASEMGLPTLGLFLITLCVIAFYTYWLYHHTDDRFIKATALGFLAGLFGLLVANLFGSRMDDQAVSSYFWVLCGLVMRWGGTERAERRAAKVAARAGHAAETSARASSEGAPAAARRYVPRPRPPRARNPRTSW